MTVLPASLAMGGRLLVRPYSRALPRAVVGGAAHVAAPPARTLATTRVATNAEQKPGAGHAPTDTMTQHGAVPAFGSHLQPADMLAFLNDSSFSAFHSNKNPAATLLGGDATLAATALTHESWKHGLHGHNRRLAFLGRRALKTFTTIFLYDTLNLLEKENRGSDGASYLRKVLTESKTLDEALRTQHLGDHVGRALALERVMRWQPTRQFDPATGTQETGLFKVRGTCTEAVLGAIYHFQGAHVAQLFYLSRILPNLDTITSAAPAPVRDAIQRASQEATEALSHVP